MFSAVLTDSLSKVYGGLMPNDFAALESVTLARADAECIQLVFDAPCAGEYTLRLPECAEAFVENFARTKDGALLPDALFPIGEDGVFFAEAGLMALWIVYRTEEDTPAGDTEAEISLLFGGVTVFSTRISVHVCDFTLPRAFSCESNTGVGKWDLAQKLGLSREDYMAGDAATVKRLDEVYRAFYEFMVEYGFSPSTLPYALTDARAARYLDDERVTSFVLPWDADDETLGTWREILLSHPAWLKKAMFYPVDEPMTLRHLETLKERAKHLRSVFPEATVVTPLHRDLQVDDLTDAFCFLEGITDLWCPKAALFSSYIYSEEQRAKYPPIGERMRARKAAGDRLWWYVCCEPAAPYANVHMDLDLIEARELFWQQSREEVDGFLYWSSTYWKNTEDEFKDAPHYLMGADKIPVYGDGVLCYMDRSGAPIPSVRLMALRAGMRDFTCLSLLKEKDEGAYRALFETFDTRVNSLVADKTLFARVRERLYRALEIR